MITELAGDSFSYRPEDEHREVDEAADDHDDACQEAGERQACGVQRRAGARVHPRTRVGETKNSTVVISDPISTTNITGFFIIVLGFSLTMESQSARFTIGESNSG